MASGEDGLEDAQAGCTLPSCRPPIRMGAQFVLTVGMVLPLKNDRGVAAIDYDLGSVDMGRSNGGSKLRPTAHAVPRHIRW
jgi:hypothetical protein